MRTQIRAADSAGADKLVSTLGTGDALKNKINTELTAVGLPESTGVSTPVISSARVLAPGLSP